MLLYLRGESAAEGDTMAKRSCDKGIPCGDTCIDPNDTCRIGKAGRTATRKPRAKKTAASVVEPREVSDEELDQRTKVGEIGFDEVDAKAADIFMTARKARLAGTSIAGVGAYKKLAREVARLSGAEGVHGKTEVFMMESGTLMLDMDNPNVDSWMRKVRQDIDTGEPILSNSEFLPSHPLPPGTGSRMLWNQARTCQRLGINKISTFGAGNLEEGNTTMNGYIVWPLLGFDSTLKHDNVANHIGAYDQIGRLYPDLMDKLLDDNLQISEILKQPARPIPNDTGSGSIHGHIKTGIATARESIDGAVSDNDKRIVKELLVRLQKIEKSGKMNGSDFWCIFGFANSMTFDTRPGSKSMETLKAYLTKRMRTPAIKEQLEYLSEKLRSSRGRLTGRGDEPDVLTYAYYKLLSASFLSVH